MGAFICEIAKMDRPLALSLSHRRLRLEVFMEADMGLSVERIATPPLPLARYPRFANANLSHCEQ
jgi:hypothetical protein